MFEDRTYFFANGTPGLSGTTDQSAVSANGQTRTGITDTGYIVKLYYQDGTWYTVEHSGQVPNDTTVIVANTPVVPESNAMVSINGSGQIDATTIIPNPTKGQLLGSHGSDTPTVIVDPVAGTVQKLSGISSEDAAPSGLVVGGLANALGGVTPADSGTTSSKTGTYIIIGVFAVLAMVILFHKKKPVNVQA